MTDVYADALRYAFLVGIGVGAVLALILRWIWMEYRHWLRVLANDRRRAMRCDIDPECVSRNGHKGSCEIVGYE